MAGFDLSGFKILCFNKCLELLVFANALEHEKHSGQMGRIRTSLVLFWGCCALNFSNRYSFDGENRSFQLWSEPQENVVPYLHNLRYILPLHGWLMLRRQRGCRGKTVIRQIDHASKANYCFASSPLLDKFYDEMFRFKLDVLGDNLIEQYVNVFTFYIWYNYFDISNHFFLLKLINS